MAKKMKLSGKLSRRMKERLLREDDMDMTLDLHRENFHVPIQTVLLSDDEVHTPSGLLPASVSDPRCMDPLQAQKLHSEPPDHVLVGLSCKNSTADGDRLAECIFEADSFDKDNSDVPPDQSQLPAVNLLDIIDPSYVPFQGSDCDSISSDLEADSDDSDDSDTELFEDCQDSADLEFGDFNQSPDSCEDREPPLGDLPLYEGASSTVEEVMLALLTFVMSHQLSGHCLADLLILLKLLLPKDNILVETVHSFFKYFDSFQNSVIRHFYCNICRDSLTSKNSICARCGPNKGVDFFIQGSITEQLKSRLQVPGFFEKLNYKNTRVKLNDAAYEDIYDGAVYKEAVRNVFGSDNWITFMWNADGFSPFKSSSYQVWPFYLSVNELPPNLRFRKENMILGGVWFGVDKPDPNVFLKPLYEELLTLKNGVEISVPHTQNPVTVKAGMLCGTCDSPAKALFTCHTQFNGKWGCPKCLSRGEKSPRTGKVFVYPFEDNLQLRTDDLQKRHLREVQRSGQKHFGVKGPSFLHAMLLVSFIRSTSIDVMHNVYLGVTKYLLKLWFEKKLRKEVFSLFVHMNLVSELLCSIKPPHFFHRAPQSLTKLAFWKASEFQSFFFYYALPVLGAIMDQVYFHHFKMLVLGVSLLCKESVTDEEIILSQSLLDEFVKQFETLYGLRYMTFNVHLLRHLPSVVKELGPLWTTTCFPFEDLNGALRNLIHGTQNAGVQAQVNFELISTIPGLVDKLAPSEIKDFCRMSSSRNARLKISEQIDANAFVVGSLKKTFPVDESLCTFLRSIRGNLYFFNRLKLQACLFVSLIEKPGRRLSCFISYEFQGQTHHGIIHVFIRVCHCENSCLICPDREYFAIVQRLECSIAFRTIFPAVDEFSTFTYNETDIFDKVPIRDIKNNCVAVSIEQESYVIDMIHMYDLQ